MRSRSSPVFSTTRLLSSPSLSGSTRSADTEFRLPFPPVEGRRSNGAGGFGSTSSVAFSSASPSSPLSSSVAARSIALFPSVLFLVTSAPWWRSISTSSTSPASAAIISGVAPSAARDASMSSGMRSSKISSRSVPPAAAAAQTSGTPSNSEDACTPASRAASSASVSPAAIASNAWAGCTSFTAAAAGVSAAGAPSVLAGSVGAAAGVASAAGLAGAAGCSGAGAIAEARGSAVAGWAPNHSTYALYAATRPSKVTSSAVGGCTCRKASTCCSPACVAASSDMRAPSCSTVSVVALFDACFLNSAMAVAVRRAIFSCTVSFMVQRGLVELDFLVQP
mmetsp:Transcript_4520/g.11612  ORF Transcript_4520/g.11612 Transcript_4520/m.11612 type:complete len:337 (-) Transcript_4520:5-1015(-)